MKDIEKNNGNKAGKGLSLWQKATVFLSLMSWFTTEQGFQNTVFVGDNPAWSMFASFAIQTILLAGVLYGAHILEHFERIQKVFCIIIWLFVAVVSIAFSYISISNGMYYVDFAVDGNQVTEKFMRETVQSLEQENLNKMKEIRPDLVSSLKAKGYDIMTADIKTKAVNYLNVTSDFQKPKKEKYLAEVEVLYLTKEERKKHEKNPRLPVTGEYVKRAYPETYKKRAQNPEFWKMKVAQTINALNREGYRQYKNVYKQELAIIKNYNKLRKGLSDKDQFPTLDQMKTLLGSCKNLKASIAEARGNIEDYKIENAPYADARKGTYSISTANTYVDKACTVFADLNKSVSDLEGDVEEMIEHSYGVGNKSVDEILALVGNSNAEISELEKAHTQMLEAQGSILLKAQEDASEEGGEDPSEDVVESVDELMSDLNNYVERARYHQMLSSFKEQCLACTYNIVKKNEDNKVETVLSCDVASGQALTFQSISSSGTAVGGLEETENVIDVTPELWTSNRKIHMSRLSALIYDYPNTDDSQYKKNLKEFAKKVHRLEKAFLDTSESEKAYNFLFGEMQYFPNKGKARLALAFAAFLDLGAALVGVLIYLVKKEGGRE